VAARALIEQVVVASRGGWNAASTRYRLGPLARGGPWPVDAVSTDLYPDGGEVAGLVARGGPGAVLVLQRVLPSADDMRRLRRAYGRILFDVDDAIYAAPPDLRRSRASAFARAVVRLALRGSTSASSRRRRLAATLRAVDVCVVGNEILARFSERYAPRSVEIPTTVEPVAAPGQRPALPVVVWLGLPDNLQYLRLVRPALRRMADDVAFRLRIVSARTWEDSPIPVEFVRWTPEAARQALLSATVGLAPLTDDPWTRGKCAHRAIQYGGHGLATVASPVGITDRVVRHGETGYLARSERDWLEALRRLLASPEQADAMGANALDHVRRHYSDELALRRWQALLASLEATPRSPSGQGPP
jgi:glycosyltransferase involved in cell wall biosynthesis